MYQIYLIAKDGELIKRQEVQAQERDDCYGIGGMVSLSLNLFDAAANCFIQNMMSAV